MKNYDYQTVIYQLNKKSSCQIKGNVIEVSKDNFDVGKNSWRKIMYLCKVHNFRYMITNFAGKSKKNKSDNEENNIKFKNNKVNINASIIL